MDTRKFKEWIPENLKSGYQKIQGVDTRKFKELIPENSMTRYQEIQGVKTRKKSRIPGNSWSGDLEF